MAQSGFAKQHLRSFIERIQRLEEEKAVIVADIREVYAEAKGQGFDPKIMRMVVRLLKMDAADRAEQFALIDLYLGALGGAPISPEVEARAERLMIAHEDAQAVLQ
jgi:uncharacterized protein (UPF0335 family)